MNLRQLLDDDDAVSPVIGVILMVAITVILAAVVATFVLGLGEQISDTAPNTNFEFSFDQGAGGDDTVTDSWGIAGDDPDLGDASLLTIIHTGGPNVDASLLGATGSSVEDGILTDDDSYGDFSTADGLDGSDVTAGTGVSVWIDDGDSINVVWESEDGSHSALLQDFDGPDA